MSEQRASTVDEARSEAVEIAIGPLVRLGPLRWERIQLVLEIEPVEDERLDPAAIRLHRTDRDPESMAPTWAEATATGAVRARFNVMLGPRQMPLLSGTWQLAVEVNQAGIRALQIQEPDIVDVFLAERVFRYRGGRYRVSPFVDRARGTVALAVQNRRNRRPRRSLPARLRRWYRQLVRRRRERIFRALLRWHRRSAPHTGRRVLFTSDSHLGLAGNLAVVHDRLLERGLDRELEIETIFKPSIASPRPWRDRWRLPRLLARADVVLLDDYQPVIYRLEPDPDQRIVQLWHASGAFKTVGYSRIGKPGGPSPYSRRHKNYTHAVVSGQHDVPYYAEAFGLHEERVLPTGIPRMDRFFDDTQRAAGRERSLRAFPAIADRRTILFAPTFRGNGPRDAWYDYERIDWPGLHAVCAEKDAVLIVKMHPFVAQAPPIPPALTDRIIDGTRTELDVNDLLFAVDLLITDYSSIVFEYSTLRRPMLFFAYDLEEYVESRDFYVPFADFVPGRIARTFAEVLDALRRDAYEAEKVAAFARRHFDHLDGGATDRVIDQLILAR